MNTHKNLTQAILQFDWMINPCGATAKGVHLYDDKLPPVQMSERQYYINIAKNLLEQIEDLLKQKLTLDEEIDLLVGKEYLIRTIADENILALWLKSPMHYIGIIAQGLNSLLTPPIESTKAQALHQRIIDSKKILIEAKINIQPHNIPQIWVQPSISSVNGLNKLIEQTLKPILRDQNLLPSFEQSIQELVEALSSFAQWIQSQEEHAQGEFAVGSEYFNTLLNEFYLVNMTTDELYEFGLEKVKLYEKKLHELATKLDSTLSWQEQLANLRKDHPSANNVIEAYRNEKEAVKKFVTEKDLVTIPKDESCIFAETPWYARASTPLGSMNTSRAFTPGLVSIFNITPIDQQAPLERQLQHLEENNYSFIKSIAFHEVIPGHHLQACLHKLQSNEFRKNFYNTVLIEGWGLYTEDLMVEEGYLQGVLQLMQLKNALWRAIRVVIDVGLHTNKLTFEQAIELLQQKTGQQRHMAQGEVLRYTQGPTYPSSYMLGREQILNLRGECEHLWGGEYSKKRFHDTLLSYGSLPVSLIRRLILEK